MERVLTHHGYTVFRAHTGRLAIAAARSTQPDVILVDQMLPETDGFELCRLLRDDPDVGPSTPILMTTVKPPTPYSHRAALRSGVWEFLLQPMHAEELRARVDTYVLLRTEPMGSTEPWLPPEAKQAEIDEETLLYSAVGLSRRARELALQAFHHHGGLACVILAPTREGDVLRVARHLKASGRRSDAIGRVGPGEFAIVAPGTDARGAVMLAERLARELSTAAPVTAETAAGAPPELRAGFDAVADVRLTSLKPGNLLQHAASALSKARASGRGDWIRAYAPPGEPRP
jgi:PleD family two-component response regulator